MLKSVNKFKNIRAKLLQSAIEVGMPKGVGASKGAEAQKETGARKGF